MSETHRPIRISRLAVGGAGALVGIIILALGLFSTRQERERPAARQPTSIREVLPDFLDEELARALGRQTPPPEPKAKTEAEGYGFLKGGEPKKEPALPPAPPVMPRARPASSTPTKRVAIDDAYAKALAAPMWAKAREGQPASEADIVTRAVLQAAGLTPQVASLPGVLSAQTPQSSEASPLRLQSPASDFVIPEGTLIPGRLVTAASSAAPGSLIAQVSRDVYDQQQEHLLLPAGSRLIGRTEDQVAYGQRKMVVAWSRILYPDGRFIELPGFAAHSPDGEAGLDGRLRRHFWEAFAPALLVSALGAIAELPALLLQQDGTTSVNVSFGGAGLTGQVTGELGLAARQLLLRGSQVAPSVEVAAGSPLVVFVGQDMAFESPYEAP